jgi:hypothetical protein
VRGFDCACIEQILYFFSNFAAAPARGSLFTYTSGALEASILGIVRECPYSWEVEFDSALSIMNWDEARMSPLLFHVGTNLSSALAWLTEPNCAELNRLDYQ